MPQKILIIGAGIIGSALAYRLGQCGCEVTLLDPSSSGGTASAASFGWVNASYENPKPYYLLRRHAMDAWTRVLPDLPDLPYTQNGTLYADFYGIPLQTLFDNHTPWGYPFEWMSAPQIADMEPNLSSPPERALFCNIEAQVLPDAAARTFAAAAQNTTRLHSNAIALRTQNNRIIGATTSDGDLTADLTILAAGTQTKDLAATAGVKIALDAPPGLLIHTKPAPRLISHTILTDGLHMQQRPDGTITAGGDFGGGSINDDPETGSKELFSRLQSALRTDTLEFSHATLGLRPTPTDGMPIVGSPTPGLYVTVMHSGATLAPGIAELATAEITAGHRDRLLNPFHPDRFDAD